LLPVFARGRVIILIERGWKRKIRDRRRRILIIIIIIMIRVAAVEGATGELANAIGEEPPEGQAGGAVEALKDAEGDELGDDASDGVVASADSSREAGDAELSFCSGPGHDAAECDEHEALVSRQTGMENAEGQLTQQEKLGVSRGRFPQLLARTEARPTLRFRYSHRLLIDSG
jgi:hypothetical protein